MYSGQGFLEAGAHYQMKSVLEAKLQVVVQNIESSNIYYLVLMWLLKIFLFVLWIGKCLLISVLRSSFSLLRKCLRSYLSVALVGLTLRTEQSHVEKDDSTLRRSSLEWFAEERVDTQVEDDLPTSPLLHMVVRDRMQICEENLAIKDRERLLYEFDKVLAPEVSAFQLGEIVVPMEDTRQLATFLKLKLSQTCKSKSSAAINAAISGVVLDIRAKGAISKCVVSWERNHRTGNIKHALVYVAARLEDGKIHLVLVGRKVEEFLGSSEFRSRFNPPRTRGDKKEWTSWTLMHLRSLREDAVVTAEELLSLGPVHAQVW